MFKICLEIELVDIARVKDGGPIHLDQVHLYRSGAQLDN